MLGVEIYVLLEQSGNKITFCSDEDAYDDGPKGDDREGACQTSGATFIIVRAKEGVVTMENSTSGATPPKGTGYNAAITRNHDGSPAN